MENLIKGDKIPESLDALIAKKDFAGIVKAVETRTLNTFHFNRIVAASEQNVILTKKVLDTIIEKCSSISNNDLLAFGHDILKIISNKSYLELQVAKIKENLAEVYSAKDDFYAAANILAEINFESQNLKYTDLQKLTNYVKIAEFYFECDDSTLAETFVKKGSSIEAKVEEREIKLRFEVSLARSLDYNRKFLQAASKYYNLSLTQGIDQENLAYLLNCAIINTLLAAAGPQRSRILSSLYKDERTKRSEHYDIFHKMYLDRIITNKEKSKLSESLKTHQKATISPGFTVLDKAVIEHNIVAISKIYETISYDSLAKLIDIPSNQLEKILHGMISEKRLAANLDQVDKFIDFTKRFEEYNNWTTGINHFCTSLDKLITKISQS